MWSNAAIFYTHGPFTYERLEDTWDVNFDGTIALFNELDELFNVGGKALFMSSNGGKYAYENCSGDIRYRIASTKSLEDIMSARNDYFEAAEKGKACENGWREHAYGMSKCFLNRYGT